MIRNYIWQWGSTSEDLSSVDYLLTAIILRPTLLGSYQWVKLICLRIIRIWLDV